MLKLHFKFFNVIRLSSCGCYASQATRLRRYDDLAKVPGLVTPPLSHYEELMENITLKPSSA
jgi:hypothetical protein